jgi:isoleucyl-tRNA synthetase
VVANQGTLTVALDITVTDGLWQEGIARELVNRIQNIRKDRGFDVTDKITLDLQKNDQIGEAISNFNDYICSETLAESLTVSDRMLHNSELLDLTDDISVAIRVDKI